MYLVTQKEAAKWFNIDPRTLRKKIKDGDIEKEPDGRIDIEKWIPRQFSSLRETAAGRKSDNTQYDLVGERARLAKAQADKTELEVDVMREKLLPADAVLQEWQACVSACRSKLLSLPSKLAFQIATLKEASEIERFLKRSVGETLTELSEYEPVIEPDNSPGSKNVDTTTGADSKPVGRRKPKAKSGSKQRTRKVGNRSRSLSKGDDGRSK